MGSWGLQTFILRLKCLTPSQSPSWCTCRCAAVAVSVLSSSSSGWCWSPDKRGLNSLFLDKTRLRMILRVCTAGMSSVRSPFGEPKYCHSVRRGASSTGILHYKKKNWVYQWYQHCIKELWSLRLLVSASKVWVQECAGELHWKIISLQLKHLF